MGNNSGRYWAELAAGFWSRSLTGTSVTLQTHCINAKEESPRLDCRLLPLKPGSGRSPCVGVMVPTVLLKKRATVLELGSYVKAVRYEAIEMLDKANTYALTVEGEDSEV